MTLTEGWQTLFVTLCGMVCATWALVEGVITQDAWWPVITGGIVTMGARAVGQKIGGALNKRNEPTQAPSA